MICLANRAAGFPDCEGFPNIIIILLVLINDFFLKLLLGYCYKVIVHDQVVSFGRQIAALEHHSREL